jgi:UDP-2,3-diacylglucosamine pyrophosphatase LpxH
VNERLIVVSDLHVAVPGPLNNFHSGKALAAFVREHALPEVTLVLAGDAFDFLQVEGRSGVLEGASMPLLIDKTFEAVAAEPWGAALFDAFGALLRSGGRCVVVPGNHDPELAHPAFATKLLARAGLVGSCPELTVHASGPWRTKIGEREVVVGHGHRNDSWNDIDPVAVEAAIAGKASPLPPGSRLVIEVLNAFKNACDEKGRPRFSFLDLLKPEFPAVPLLLIYLDRRLAMSHLMRALGIGTETLVNALLKWIEPGPTLAPERDVEAQAPVDDVARALAGTYTVAQRDHPSRCAGELEEWLNSEGAQDGPGDDLLAAHGGLRSRVLRAFLQVASDEGHFFDEKHLSAHDSAIVAEHLPADAPARVVIAGHTHAAREVALDEERTYINTGTWTDLMAFPDKIDDVALRDWIDRLERDDVPRKRHLTYAEVTAEGAALRQYKGE